MSLYYVDYSQLLVEPLGSTQTQSFLSNNEPNVSKLLIQLGAFAVINVVNSEPRYFKLQTQPKTPLLESTCAFDENFLLVYRSALPQF